MRRTWQTYLFLSVFVGLFVACGGEEGVSEPVAAIVDPTATLLPTPTLAAGLPTPTPLPPTPTPIPGSEGTNVSPPSESTLLPTVTPLPTITPTPTPTPILSPAESVTAGDRAMKNGDYTAAVTHYTAALHPSDALSETDQKMVLYNLGVAYVRDGRFSAATELFQQLLAQTAGEAPSSTYFYLGQIYAALGDYQAAVGAYRTYLDRNAEMAAYIYPYLADAYLSAGDVSGAIEAYSAALIGPAHRLTTIDNHRRLADLYASQMNYEAAIAQYDAIHNLALTEFTRGEMTYLAGSTAVLAGDTETGYARYLQGVAAYPRAYESYLGLVALVEAGVAVDEFQRGLVNFYADSYQPAIAAFGRYRAANPETYRPDTHLYLAWSYEGLGDTGAALAALDDYALIDPAVATIERAKLLVRANDISSASDTYLAFLETFPNHESAPFAAWWAAVLMERMGDMETAVRQYQFMADQYSWHEDAPEALFRAGWLAYRRGDVGTAVPLWRRATQQYPQAEYGAASLVWLLRTLPAYQPAPAAAATAEATAAATATPTPDPAVWLAEAEQQALASRSLTYYALRASDLVRDMEPFTAAVSFVLPNAETGAAEQIEAEAWLRAWLNLEPGNEVSALSPTLLNDRRRIVGEKLWQLGLYEEAKRELESLRMDSSNSALHSYQLALYFRDLGLYRSSIIAASTVLSLSGQTVFDAPRFIGRLAYPIYYADLIMPLAGRYNFDPRLQFSLVRQESLFESFARSGAAAQGLSQVIPDTGAFIAQRLQWPDYDNDDLYKPYVGLNFGAFYLDQQLAAFDGHVHAALSAYNAGPGNAARWYDLAAGDHDLYLEMVNFSETRLYIERIYIGYVIYRFLYGEEA